MTDHDRARDDERAPDPRGARADDGARDPRGAGSRKCRPLPPTVVDGRAAREPDGAEEAALLARLDEALRGLPDDQRTAVIASYAYGEGVVGAAVELDVETAAAHALGERGLAALRTAMRDDEA